MATITERLALLISADVKGAVQGLNEVGKASKQHLGESEKRIDKVGRTFSKVGTGMLAVGGAAAAGLYQTVGAASDLEQAVGGTEAVFKEASNVIDAYAKDAADAAGLSERAFREATTGIGGNLKRMGFSVDEAAQQSANLTQVAADLAATYGGTTAEAVSALGAAFRGEADPAERFNLNLKISAVNAKAVELGLADSTAAVDDNARAQGLLALITEQSADAQGQFAREADSAAGSAQIASAKFENAKAALGESLAPVMADAAGLASNLFDKFNQVNESTDGMAAKLVIGATGFTIVGGAMLTVAGKAIQLNRSLRDAEGNLTGAGRAASRLGKVLGGLAIAGLAIEFHKWADSMSALNTEVSDLEGAATDELADALNEIIQAGIGQTGGKAPDAALKLIMETLTAMAAESPAVVEQLIGIAETADGQLARSMEHAGLTVEDLQAALDAGIGTQAKASKAQERSAEILDEVTGATDTATSSWEDYTTGVEDAIKPHEALEDAIKEVNDALKAQFDPLFAVSDALDDNQKAQQAVVDAGRDAKRAQDEYNAAVKEFGRKSPEAAEAARRLERAQRDVTDANRDAGRSAIDVTTASTNLAAQMRAGNTDFEAAEQQISAWADQGLITEKQAEDMRVEMFLAALAADELSKRDVVVEVTADTTKFWKAISELFSGETGALIGMGDVGGPLIVPEFNKAEGGFIPGPKGAPRFGIAHGGEYVVSNEELDSMRRSGSAASDRNAPLVVIENMNVRDQPAEESIVTELRRMRHLQGIS